MCKDLVIETTTEKAACFAICYQKTFSLPSSVSNAQLACKAVVSCNLLNIQARTGFKPMTSEIPMQHSTN